MWKQWVGRCYGILIIGCVIASVAAGCRRVTAVHPADHTLVVGIPADPHHLDPRIGTDKASYDFHRLLYSGLIQRDRSDRLVPDIAERWERLDDRTFRFYLRPDVTFHDGRRLTARDVKYTYMSILKGRVQTLKRGAFDDLEGVTVVSDRVVDFHLRRPNSSFLINLTLGIVPEGYEWQPGKLPMGSGPFRMVTMRRGVEYVMVPHSNYHGPKPRIRRLILRVIPDMMVRWLELRKGTLDLVMSGWSPDILRHVDEVPHLKAVRRPSSNIAYITFNLRNPYLRDHRVREALALAVDRKTIIQAFFMNSARLADSLLYPGHWAYVPAKKRLSYNPRRARELLDAAGYPDPDGPGPAMRFRLVYKTSTNPFRLEIAQVLQYELKQVGIDLRIESLEWGTFYHDITHGNFDMYTIVRVGISDPDIFTLVFHSGFYPPHGANRGFYRNPELDRLLDEARRIYDPAERRRRYARVQAIIRHDLPCLYLWYEPNIAIMKKTVHGFDFYPNADYYTLVRVYKSE